jgi:hypothetical protein
MVHLWDFKYNVKMYGMNNIKFTQKYVQFTQKYVQFTQKYVQFTQKYVQFTQLSTTVAIRDTEVMSFVPPSLSLPLQEIKA